MYAPRHYCIVVEDELGTHLAETFAGLKIEPADGTTTLSGLIRDQAELHGILTLIGLHQLTLRSVHTIP